MRGVYFLANDTMRDLAIAFLNSFRYHNPTIPLCLIPFDDTSDNIAALGRKYNFSVIPKAEPLLAHCDQISSRFYGPNTYCGQYRKLALWDLIFDEFLYIDVDTVVVNNVDFAFDFLSSYDFIASISNDDGCEKWVWLPTIRDAGKLTEDQIRYSANTGFILSNKNAMSMKWIDDNIDAALGVISHMTLWCSEQPVLNYLIVTSGKRYTSLYKIAKDNKCWHSMLLEYWAPQVGEWLPRNALLLHWAGVWQRGEHNAHKLWQHYRNLELKDAAV